MSEQILKLNTYSIPEEYLNGIEVFNLRENLNGTSDDLNESTKIDVNNNANNNAANNANNNAANNAKNDTNTNNPSSNITSHINNISYILENTSILEDSDLDSDSDSDSDSDTITEKKNDNKILESEDITDLNLRETHTINNTIYFTNSKLKNEKKVLSVCSSIFTKNELHNPIESLIKKQLNTIKGENNNNNNNNNNGIPYSIVFLLGGGHFIGAIFSHKLNQAQQPNIIKHKSIHRYTTRRKQGGSQSTSDNAHGKATSAGSNLRRYNEMALKNDIKLLLQEWKNKGYLKSSEIIYIRAPGKSGRSMMFQDSFLDINDPKIRPFPFTTNRPNLQEAIRAWLLVTSCQIQNIPQLKPTQRELQFAKEKAKEKALQRSLQRQKPKSIEIQDKDILKQEENTNNLIKIIKRSRVAALISYIKNNNLNVNYYLEPKSKYKNTPTLLHFASSDGKPLIVKSLLIDLNADPTITTDIKNQTACDLALDDSTKEQFSYARHILGENKWNWSKAHVGLALNEEDLKNKALERENNKMKEQEISKQNFTNIINQTKNELLDSNSTKGPKGLGAFTKTNQNLGLNPMASAKLERERRARAAEARMKNVS